MKNPKPDKKKIEEAFMAFARDDNDVFDLYGCVMYELSEKCCDLCSMRAYKPKKHNRNSRIKELLKSLFIIREGGAWSFSVMHSGLKHGTGKRPQDALNDFIKNYENNKGVTQ